ncbi:MAG: ATP-dependent Clp protease adaptor ClpS [Cytophagaceae bacterium]|nr:ATP-dependent Clp protease adaptor ClpS [Cytophagaceae bacterium]
MKFAPEVEIEIKEEVEVDVEAVKLYAIVVFNDEVNTFDHVIDTLIEVCGHSFEQAEQCTLIIHYKGKCSVKNGDFDDLKPIRDAICERGISAEILLR